MSKTYNGLVKPILLFNKENEVLTPQPSVQPSYGPWASLSNAKAALIDEFEDIANVPKGYTFAILNSEGKPEEYWFSRWGDWSSVIPKCEGSALKDLLKFKIEGDTLYVSYDGGNNYTSLGKVVTPEAAKELIRLKLDNDGTLKISYDGGRTYEVVGKFKFKLTDTGYLKISFDDGTTWITAEGHITPGGGSGQTGPTGGGSTPVGNITVNNVGEIAFKGSTFTGQDACDVLVYMGIDYPTDFSSVMSTKFPAAQVGDYVIIRSLMYDRTGGMSNASDGTHTYELDPNWTVQDVLDNSTQDDYYYYYKATKIDQDAWAALAWIGRAEKTADVTRHTVTIGPFSPSEAEVKVTYNGVDYPVHAGSTITVDEGATIVVTAAAEGYNSYTHTYSDIQDDFTTDAISLTPVATGYPVTVNSCTTPNVKLWYAIIDKYFDSADDLNHDQFTEIQIGDTFIVPYGKTYDLRCEPIWQNSGTNYAKWRETRTPNGPVVYDISLKKADVMFRFVDGTHAKDAIDYYHNGSFQYGLNCTGQNIGLDCIYYMNTNDGTYCGDTWVCAIGKEGYYMMKAVDTYRTELQPGVYDIPINLEQLPNGAFLRVTPFKSIAAGSYGYETYEQNGDTLIIHPHPESVRSGSRLKGGFMIESNSPVTWTSYPGLNIYQVGNYEYPSTWTHIYFTYSDYAEFDITNGTQTIHVQLPLQ